MDSSPKLLWDDPSLYSESCGVMDPTIRDLDQQIMLNDMILCANGGMPYLDPALQGNPPPVSDNSWQQYYENGFEGGSLPPSSTHPSHTQTSAGNSQMMMDANAKLCDRSRGQPQAPSSENRTSHHPSARAPYHHGAARRSESNGSSKGTSCSSASASATSTAAATSISANSPPKSAPGNQNQDPEPPDRHLDLTQRDMSTAMRQVAAMGNHLRNAAHEQRKMVDDTLSQWTGSEMTRL
ncbi:hypothetical protein PG988_010597 [Apiospora saccharicola]